MHRKESPRSTPQREAVWDVNIVFVQPMVL
jgi:hypothetical protein